MKKRKLEHKTGCVICGTEPAFFYKFFGAKLCKKHFAQKIRRHAIKLGLPILILIFMTLYNFQSQSEPQPPTKAGFSWTVSRP